MPYKADGSDVPERIAGLSATKRRQFAAVRSEVLRKLKSNTEANITFIDFQEPTFEDAYANEIYAMAYDDSVGDYAI